MLEYNKDLILKNNVELFSKLKNIPQNELQNIINEVILREVSLSKLKQEFITNFDGFVRVKAITGENIKCFFSISLNGTSKIWKEILKRYPNIFSNQKCPLYENVLEYIDKMLDKINFDELFKQELTQLNSII